MSQRGKQNDILLRDPVQGRKRQSKPKVEGYCLVGDS